MNEARRAVNESRGWDTVNRPGSDGGPGLGNLVVAGGVGEMVVLLELDR